MALYPYGLISFGLGQAAISVVAKRPMHASSTEYKHLFYPYLTIQFKKSPGRVQDKLQVKGTKVLIHNNEIKIIIQFFFSPSFRKTKQNKTNTADFLALSKQNVLKHWEHRSLKPAICSRSCYSPRY